MIQKATSARLGLALSGGGFRAVLYHLGVVRFLRDAGLLSQVTRITSVSGGSVLGAHLVLNWDRYCGSEAEFQEVSGELLRFLQLDVRNRIVRRFPLAALVNTGRRALRREPWRQYTRAGLLEQHYEKFLYGDTGLFQLPDNPRLYILATNLSEGSLCAFHRDGLLLQRRSPDAKKLYFEDVEIGLATVPMAVAASSAFPGFFPPLELRGTEVGAREGEFGRHAFTDGGIYDNLGLRMFHHLQQVDDQSSRAAGVDIVDSEALQETLRSGAQMPEGTALRELTRRIFTNGSSPRDLAAAVATLPSPTCLAESVARMSRRDRLYRLPAFQSVPLSSQQAEIRLREVRASSNEPELSERIWLNCELAAAALEQAAGKPCLQLVSEKLDGVLVSDAGASFKVWYDGRAGGLLSTAIRSSDILMDRVNQLELESFSETEGALFFHISRVVKRSEDPTAPHPEIQRQAAHIRTDMDRFSGIEITSLVQHGYCVARQAFRERREGLLGGIPETPPWDPLAATAGESSTPVPRRRALRDEALTLTVARKLQCSSARRTVSTLFSLRDWPTYLWLPLLAMLIFTLPYLLYTSHQTAIHQGYVLSAVAQTSPVYRQVLHLLDQGPMSHIRPLAFEDVESIEPLDFTGYDVISDDRIYDMRGWAEDDNSVAWTPRMHARFRMRRTEQAASRPHLRIQLPSLDEQLSAEFFPESLAPSHRRTLLPSGLYVFETTLDFRHVPIGTDTNVIVNQILPKNVATQQGGMGRFQFSIAANTGLARIWVLMPEKRKHDQFELVGFPMGQPDHVEVIDATTTVELPIGAIATFQMINPKNHYRYECRWRWCDQALVD